MTASSHTHDFSHLQDVLGNVSTHKRYIVLCLCFQLQETTSISEVESVLADALRKVSDSFPFLAGQVVFEGRKKGITGRPKVIPLERSIQLLIKDLRQDPNVPSMAQLSQANYPFYMLDAETLIPEIAISWPQDEHFASIAPVFLMQANLVKNGLLLVVTGNHFTMDLAGMGQMIALFAKACRGDHFTMQQIKQGNQDRRNIVPLLGDQYQIGPELNDVLKGERDTPNTSALPPLKWAYFSFSATNLSQLKAKASQQDLAPYISTDDAITALCWQRVTKARLPRLPAGTNTTLARPIDVRKYLGLQGYLGHMVDVAYESEVDVWSRTVGEVAGRLRRELLQESKITHHVRAYATALSRLSDKSKMMNGAHLDPDRDVIVVSYASGGCSKLSFGTLLGTPSTSILPGAVNSLAANLIILPRSASGDIAVAACLREDELEKLRLDEVFSSYAEFVG